MKNFCSVVALMLFALGTALAQTTVTTNGGTTNSVPKFTNGSMIGNSAITETNGSVGIGTTTPSATLTVQGTNVSSFVNGYGVSGQSFTPTLGTFASEGTPASPSGVLAGDRLLSLYNWAQYDTTPGHGISGASIDFYADENFAASRNGTDIRFLTAINGSGATRVERMRVDNTGNVGIGTTTPGQKLEVNGSIKLTGGSGGAVVFADGSVQTTATLQGPPGPQGATGATGPQGPQGPPGPPGPQITTTYNAFCAGAFGSSDSVVLNPLGQNSFPNCFLLYNGFGVRYVPEFGNGSQSGDFPIYIDSPSNTTVDTQYGFAVPRAGTLANLRATAITRGSSGNSGVVLVRKIHANNTIDNTSSDILLTCTIGTGTSCSDTTHTLSISAGERIIVTVKSSTSETLASVSVLVDLQ